MLPIAYDSTLVEKTVFLAARTDADLERKLHEQVDPLYEIGDAEFRQQKFAECHRGFFSEMHLDRLIAGLIAERPLIARDVDSCVVREAFRLKDESAELLVKEERRAGHPLQRSDAQTSAFSRTLVLQVCPESLIESKDFALRMRRELLHVSDMLDERFGYDRSAVARLGPTQHLVRDRYRVLWDVYVEGRLVREGHSDWTDEEPLKRGFAQVYVDHVARSGLVSYDRVFAAESLAHSTLLDWAKNPEQLFAPTGETTACAAQPNGRPSPGDRCPLCGFPTHDWYELDVHSDHALAIRIAARFQDWSPGHGVCRQCAEMHTTAT